MLRYGCRNFNFDHLCSITLINESCEYDEFRIYIRLVKPLSRTKAGKSTGGITKIGSLQTKASISVQAESRQDSWGNNVKIRLSTVLDDKSTMKIRFHNNCRKLFWTKGREWPFSPPSTSSTPPSASFSQSPNTPSPPAAQRRRMDVTPSSPARRGVPLAATPTPKQQLTGPGRPPHVLTPSNVRDNAGAG